MQQAISTPATRNIFTPVLTLTADADGRLIALAANAPYNAREEEGRALVKTVVESACRSNVTSSRGKPEVMKRKKKINLFEKVADQP